MSAKRKSRSLLVCCAFLFLAGVMGTTVCQGQGSVLSRVQTIDNPELGELIRVALENLPKSADLAVYTPDSDGYDTAVTARLKTVRLVTEAYVNIKLLDSQIEQSTGKLASSNLPEALARELFLAKVELESQRATKLAELREIMHIIPRHALGRKPVKDLKGWLRLGAVGDSVLVFTGAKPFTENEFLLRHVFVKSMSRKEATKYALDYVLNRDHHPVRVDILPNRDGMKFSEELQKELISTVRRTKLEMDAEVHLSEDVQKGHEKQFYALGGKLGSSFVRSSGRPRIRIRIPIDAKKFEEYIHSDLVGGPERLPVKFLIRYDEQSKDLALRAEQTIGDIVKKRGVDKLVEVALEQIDPDEMK